MNYTPDTIRQLLSKGLSASAIANLLDAELEEIQQYSTPRVDKSSDAEELTLAMNQFAWRAFDEGMKMLDEGTPAIKLRLIQGAMGHTLRLLNAQSPKELDDTRSELSSLLQSVSTDDNDVNSIYAQYPDPDEAVYLDPSTVAVDSVSGEVDDSDEGPID